MFARYRKHVAGPREHASDVLAHHALAVRFSIWRYEWTLQSRPISATARANRYSPADQQHRLIRRNEHG